MHSVGVEQITGSLIGPANNHSGVYLSDIDHFPTRLVRATQRLHSGLICTNVVSFFRRLLGFHCYLLAFSRRWKPKLNLVIVTKPLKRHHWWP